MKQFAAQGTRRCIRLRGYDYSQPGAYFVTVCTYRKQMLFGEIINERMDLNGFAKIVEACWLSLPDHFDYVILDEFLIMPNHFHAILFISTTTARVNGVMGAKHASPEGDLRVAPTKSVARIARGSVTPVTGLYGEGDPWVAPTGPRPRSLAAVIGSFKSAVTRQVHAAGHCLGSSLWQRTYYEHVVRDEASSNRIREYISPNPVRWELDRENPDKKKLDEFDVWLDGFKKRPRRVSRL
jgi:putative transposase